MNERCAECGYIIEGPFELTYVPKQLVKVFDGVVAVLKGKCSGPEQHPVLKKIYES